MVVQIFTFLHLHFFALIQEVAIKITNILQKQEEKKTSKLHNPDRIKGEMCAVAKGA